MSKTELQVPFGAVYFRKSNPPREDWERDYGIAAEDGLNVFRHWFMWSAIERAPGVYDWEEYDRQLDLAAANGIKTIVAELTHTAPDWALRKFAQARQRYADGRPAASIMGVSAATGGFSESGGGGLLTFNCPEAWEAAKTFLTTMAERYKGHPGLLGYDVWNECNYSPRIDYSAFTAAAFRDWLKAKYGSLETLAKAWYRYSYAEWEDIEPPHQTAPYPECLDWLQFKRDNFYDQMQWRIDAIRAVDPDCLIAAHGVGGAIPDMAARGCDDWRAASKVQVYGYTWIQARKGNQPWRSWYAADLNRAAARGKPFWHAERQGGPLWMQPQVVGRDKEDGRIPEPEDIRVWTMTSFAGGARGVLNLRYRPLLDGPLFGAFGSYDMDGSRTSRSDMASDLAKWANAPEQKPLFAARPIRGEIGILVVPEVQEWDYLLSYEGKYDTYAAAMWGAYRGFFDNGFQADWVHADDIDGHDVLYFPYPIMLTAARAKKLADWVEAGGTLIAEACPGYFGDRGRVGTVQPNLGLDAVFGAREDHVEFMPDIRDRIRFNMDGLSVRGGGFLQAYRCAGGTPYGWFDDGRLAVVANSFGKGRTLLVGTHPSVGYYRSSEPANRRFFAECAAYAGKIQHVQTNNPQVQIRVHREEGRTFLWFINPTRQLQTGHLALFGSQNAVVPGRVHWAEEGAVFDGRRFCVPARDALILEVEPR
ncbi:beta-galactosidase [Consotaella aegiceratis]|uniref:beta-galactosidase n=1 Tax=Consotaella aegiceratis TaxID=3097961 RepID=UPI002F41C13B